MKRFIFIVAVLVICAIFTLACAAPAPTQTPGAQQPTTTTAKPSLTPQAGGNFKLILSGNSASLGTIGSPSEGVVHRVSEVVFEFLLRYDTDGRFQPRLAESWEIAPDGKSLTLRLRKGVKFHDGTDFNAEAVKYNLENYTSGTTKVRPATLLNISSYDIIDPYTIRLNLKVFDIVLLDQLSDASGMMASPTALKIPTSTDTLTNIKNHMVGTGPFTFVSWQRATSASFKKYDGYWQKGKPYLDNWDISAVVDTAVSVMSFKRAEANLIYGLTARDAHDLAALGYEVVVTDAHPVIYMIPDGANADSPFANIKLRQAVEYAIDKKSIAAAIGQEYYTPLYQLAEPQDARFVQGLTTRNYDPKKAKQLVAEAGYPNGFKTTIITDTAANRDVMVAIQTNLKEAGIEATLDFQDATRMTNTTQKGWKNGLLMPVTGLLVSLRSFSQRFASTTASVSMFKPSGWQEKVDATVAQPDDNKRLSQYRELTKIMFDQVMVIPLWTSPELSAMDKKIHDIKWTKGGHPRFYEPQDAWLSK